MEPDKQQYREPTTILNFNHPSILSLFEEKRWHSLSTDSERIDAIYTYVRDAIPFGYTKHFAVPASTVLEQGMGNCITKTTLLMALLRSAGYPCRLRAAMISKVIHRGLLGGLPFLISPRHLHHAWVELYYQDHWLEIGGHIVDKPYLEKLQQKFSNFTGSFYGYGIAVTHFRNPPIRWEEEETEIQSKAIRESLHTFANPDAFFIAHPEAEQRTHSLSYTLILRPTLNRSIRNLRKS